MNLQPFIAEFRRRNVYKVAVAYSVVGWLIAQIQAGFGNFDSAITALPYLLEMPAGIARADLRFNPRQRTASSPPATSSAIGLVLQVKGDLPGASAEFQKARELSNDPYVLVFLAVAKSKLGDTSMLRQAVTEVDRTDPHRQGFAYDRAILGLGMNKKDEALRWLEQNFADRDGQRMDFIKVDPMLAPLRGDPRFEALAEKIVPTSQFKGTTISK